MSGSSHDFFWDLQILGVPPKETLPEQAGTCNLLKSKAPLQGFQEAFKMMIIFNELDGQN